MKKDSIVYTVLFTLIVCILFVVPLSLANELTRERVEVNKKFAVQSAVLSAFGIPFTNAADAQASYTSLVGEIPGSDGEHGSPAYKATVEGASYIAVRQSGAGLWGTITIVVAAAPDGTRLRGIEILDQMETPGLGGRIAEAWFKDQFRDKKVGSNGTITIDQNGSGSGEKDKESPRADAVSGASRSSSGVEMIINNAIAAVKKLGGTP